MKKVTVLLADDNPDMLCMIQEMLFPTFDIVAIARDGESLVAAAKDHQPDVIITDISMPVLTGIEATVEILRQIPETRIIALTVNRDKALVDAALGAGALGYVLKMSAGEDLIFAISQVMAGRPFVSPALQADDLKDSYSDLYLSADSPGHSSPRATKI